MIFLFFILWNISENKTQLSSMRFLARGEETFALADSCGLGSLWKAGRQWTRWRTLDLGGAGGLGGLGEFLRT